MGRRERGRRPGGPARERVADRLLHRRRRELADDVDVGARGAEVGRVEAADLGQRVALERGLAGEQPAVRVAGVQHRPELLERDLLGVGLRDRQVAELVRLEPRELRLGELRVSRHVGHQGHRLRSELREDVGRDLGRVRRRPRCRATPPIRAASSEICTPVRVAVPSRMRAAVRSASQTCSAVSLPFPAAMESSTVTLGVLPHWTRVAFMPFGSVKRVGAGSWKPLGAAGAGGVAFAAGAAPAAGCCAAAASAGSASSERGGERLHRVPPCAAAAASAAFSSFFGSMVSTVRFVVRRYSRAAFWMSSGVTFANSASSALIFEGSSSKSA